VINSAYRKVLDFKENAEKILEKEKSETLCLDDFSKAILDSRSFEISLQHNCIKLKCYITLEKDKDKKKLNSPTQLQQQTRFRSDTNQSCDLSSPVSMASSPNGSLLNNSNGSNGSSGSNGAKKVNVEVIMKSNPFRVG
jgi:hypothetical protein